MTDDSSPDPVVTILGGDVVVGRALESWLRSADCDARFLPERSTPHPSWTSDETGLLLLAPGLSGPRREAALRLGREQAGGRAVPLLELVAGAEAAQVGEAHFVYPWPCQMEGLQRRIEALLAPESRDTRLLHGEEADPPAGEEIT